MSTREKDVFEEPSIDIQPMAGPKASHEMKQQILELQLQMATCSINHEYARIEFEDVSDRERREELLDYMHECRCKYLEARSGLNSYDPYALADFEVDLMRQKQITLGGMQA